MTVSTFRLVIQLATTLALLALGSAAYAGGADTDSDGVPDAVDNCILVSNPLQQDTNADSFGNACDGDFDNNGIVNLTDLALVRQKFFAAFPAPAYDPDVDMNSDLIINFADLALLKAGFFLPPGPSANAVPTDIQLDNNSVDENQPAGTSVGTFTTTDLNATDTHTYTLVGGAGSTDNAQFMIVGDVLQTAAVLNYEAADNCLTSATTCSIRVQTDDGNGGTYQESFVINIVDVNDDPTDIALDNSNVDENQPVGTAVGNLSTTDEDTADTHTYTLVAGAGDTDNASFGIVVGQLQTAAIFDFETQGPFSIRVQTDDGSGGLYEEVFTITVNDLNEAATSIGLAPSAVDENQPANTVVGNLSNNDPDGPGATYTLVAGAGDSDNALFNILGGQLRTSGLLDFEASATRSVRVQIDDGAGGIYAQQITITVNNLNDAPTDIALDSTDVVEGQPVGTAVGSFSTADEDVADSHTYMLVAGAGSTDNASFTISAVQLLAAAIFDESVQNSYSIRVQTDDGNGGVFQEVFTITVLPDNSAPTDIALSNTSVDENLPAGTSVGTFTTTDLNATDTHTYTLVGGAGSTDNAQFMIVGDVLQTAAVLNYEAAGSCLTSDTTCSIRVQTDDGNGGTYQESFIISINDVNDPPGAVNDSYTGAIGNTQFALVAALSGTPPFPATVELVGSVGDNDPDEDGDTVGAVAAMAATTQGGSVTIDAAGRFVYRPPAGFTGGNDTFTYTPSDGVNPAASTATVTISVANRVWYVDDSSPNNPGTGTSADPFQNLSSASPGPTMPGETIFVYAGTQTTGISLQNNQSLLGEGVALVVGPTTLSSASTRPVISTAVTAITLGASNTVRGLNITGSNTGIVGSSGGTLTADNMAISTTGGPGIDLTGGAGLVTLDSLSSAFSSSEGIDLNSVSGSFTLGGGAISGSFGNAFDVSSSSATISYDGTINTTTPRPVRITGQSSMGSVTFGGAIATTGQGIDLTSNAGTITFAGGMSLTTGSDIGFNATGGGTLNICDDTNCSAPGGIPVTNTIQNGSATALNVSGVNIGNDGLTFRLISSNGGPAGIVLNNTGTAGGLTVTGDGSTAQGGNDTGGIIQNKAGDGISLTSTRDVTLQNMTIGDTAASTANGPDAINNIVDDGIQVTSVTNLTLQSVTIARTGGHGVNAISGMTNLVVDDSLILNAGDGQEEHGLNLDELRGDNFVRDSQFDAFNETAIEVVNASGTVDLTISNTRFQDNKATVGNAGEEAILLEALGSATIVVLVTGSSVFDDIATQAIQALSIGSTSMIHLTVQNSSFVEHASGDGIIIMNPDGGGSGNVTVRGNIFTDDTFGPFAVIAKSDSSGTLDATIQSNAVTSMQLLNVNHDDIGGAGAANGTSRILVGGASPALGNTNNVGSNNISIDIIATETGPVGTDPDLSVTVMNNMSTQPDNNFTFTPGLRIDAQNNSRLNANIFGNAFQGDPTCCGGSGIEIRELNAAIVRFQGFAGGNTAAATAFMDSQNPASSLPSFLFSAGGTWGSGAATLPIPTTLPSP